KLYSQLECAEQSGGQNLRLDLQKLTQFSFFPWKVVGIEGHNPSGHCLIVSKVVDSIPLSVSSDLELPPSKNFVNCQQILTAGPFVDSEHPEIKREAIDRSFDDIFHVEILRRLQEYTEYMGPASRVILVPSIRDVSHDFVFPQVKIRCHTIDVLKHFSSKEISRIPTDGTRDRMVLDPGSTLSNRSGKMRWYYAISDSNMEMKAVRAAMDYVAIRWIFIKFNNQLDKVIQEIEAKRIFKNVYRTLIENLDKFFTVSENEEVRYSEIFSLYESHFKHLGLCWDLNRTLSTSEYDSRCKFNRIPGSSFVDVDDIKDENTDDQVD
ncbi:hypothetical protein GIB67_018795, partial [Kingdonia uniflora]